LDFEAGANVARSERNCSLTVDSPASSSIVELQTAIGVLCMWAHIRKYWRSLGPWKGGGILRTVYHVIADITANCRTSLQTVRILLVRQFAVRSSLITHPVRRRCEPRV